MMIRRVGPRLLAAQFAADLLLTICSVRLAEQARLNIQTGWERRGEIFVPIQPWVYVVVLAGWALFLVLFGYFDADRRQSLASDIGRVWLSVTIAMLSLASLFYLLAPNPAATPSRLFYLYLYVINVLLLSLAHVAVFHAVTWLRRRGRHMRRVLLVGGGVHGRHVAVRLRGQENTGISLCGFVSRNDGESINGLERLGTPDDVAELVRRLGIAEVVVALPAEAHMDALRVTGELQDTGINLRILPDVFEMATMKARVEDFYGLPLISITEPSINALQARIKRLFDVFVSSILLVILAPIIALVAIWVKLDSPGPVFIHQRRVGAGGTVFFMHKFRSMIWNPETLDGAHPKRPHDPRVTRSGRPLRRSSLDEVPQLWNVLRGEMSLVGPRPELPAVAEQYEPWQRRRLLVPPGMTGWWQVNGRSERSMHLNTEIDLYYVQNYSILLDLRILARTLGAVIRGKGAF